ncbi:hypothetical protein AMS68_002538 [Peltaster fructicola]|uniref:Receptor L-domain domain-containing protein n=1 Tax=Peltaster fructicola TaxID=286661 RepID=A0A6H0XQU6_9PEZI|nr:hypothetical protein AMS68_002538 [Peltaster fructicola]
MFLTRMSLRQDALEFINWFIFEVILNAIASVDTSRASATANSIKMAAFRFILPALAIAAGVSAQSSSCSISSTTTIQNSGDGRALASCTTFSGSIAIATGTTDTIDLSGIQEITGSLTADSARMLPGLVSTDMTTIGSSFTLSNLSVLSTLTFPSLSSVQTIDWNGLPALQGLTFTKGVQMASSLSVQNTQLGSLSGINLAQVDTVVIANNGYLNDINMQLGNVTNNLRLQANGGKVVATFPNLIWANNLDINNVTTFSVPSLAAVNKTLNLQSDYFTSFSAANLTSIGQDLIIKDCSQLNNLSFPLLTTVTAALTVANNSKLTQISGFPQLNFVGGALDFTGNFSSATLPSIKTVRGTFNVQSQQNIDSTCSTFQSLAGINNVIQGPYTCNGTVANPTTEGGSSGTSSSSSSKSSTAAASAMQLPAITGLLGVVAAVFGLL